MAEDARAIAIIKKHVLKSYGTGDSTNEAWRALPEIPSSSEIQGAHDKIPESEPSDDFFTIPTARATPLPHNNVDGPWDSAASYIGAHYQLLREDAIYPLRAAVAQVKRNPTMKDTLEVAIYTHVHIVGVTASTQGPGIKVEFSYENAGKRIRWEHSSRLQQGTIVALTPRSDMFSTVCKVAWVAARTLENGVWLNPPRVDLFWGNWDEAEFDPSINWVMVEARSGYWESFRHMGVALQKLRTESFPLSEYLVDLQENIDSPSHIKRNPYMDMKSLLPDAPVANFDEDMESHPEFENVDILGTWPKIPSNLDASQLQATKRILTKKIAIVQGPPGTGKTHVSVTSLKVMLQNWSPGDPPIIIAAQTNHALDQLLSFLAPYVPDFIRLGGRSTDETGLIKSRTIFEVRKKQPVGLQGGGRDFFNSRHAMEKARARMLEELQLFIDDAIPTAQNLLDLGIISQEQFDSLHDPGWTDASCTADSPPSELFNWVGGDKMCRLESRCPPITTLFEEEENNDDFENLNEEEGESSSKFREEDEIEMLRGDFYNLNQSWTGKRAKLSRKKILAMLEEHDDLEAIRSDYRGDLFCYFIEEVKKITRQKFRENCKEYMRCVANNKISKWIRDARMLKKINIKVIGCTTTGLSKYRGLIAALEPRTLLIEEAAETVEGTVLASIFESLDQLILVGDHQQLQANPNREDLAHSPYNLSVSMFERLVKCGIEHTMLNTQRRMIPAIRRLFDHIYPGLTDHESVLDVRTRYPLPGVKDNLWFFSHVWPESRVDTSRCNFDEAEMVTKFYAHLFFNGLDPSKITILTFYNGQRKLLLKLLKQNPNLSTHTRFNVFTVDSYQGEENDVILLSLVRSNDRQDNGFLAVKNRAVVSLSRARCGMYLFGNALSLVANDGDHCYDVWAPVLKEFQRHDLCREFITLKCKNHGTETNVSEAYAFEKLDLVGGCEQPCAEILPCGHTCKMHCHPFDHSRMMCKVPCERRLGCNHPCKEMCGSDCSCVYSCMEIPPESRLQSPQREHALIAPQHGQGQEDWNADSTGNGTVPAWPTAIQDHQVTANRSNRALARHPTDTGHSTHNSDHQAIDIPHPRINGHPNGQNTSVHANGHVTTHPRINGHPNGQNTSDHANGHVTNHPRINGHPNGQNTSDHANGHVTNHPRINGHLNGQNTSNHANGHVTNHRINTSKEWVAAWKKQQKEDIQRQSMPPPTKGESSRKALTSFTDIHKPVSLLEGGFRSEVGKVMRTKIDLSGSGAAETSLTHEPVMATSDENMRMGPLQESSTVHTPPMLDSAAKTNGNKMTTLPTKKHSQAQHSNSAEPPSGISKVRRGKMKVSAPPRGFAPSNDHPLPEAFYSEQLCQLNSMGFVDNNANITALVCNDGDLQGAIEHLFYDVSSKHDSAPHTALRGETPSPNLEQEFSALTLIDVTSGQQVEGQPQPQSASPFHMTATMDSLVPPPAIPGNGSQNQSSSSSSKAQSTETKKKHIKEGDLLSFD